MNATNELNQEIQPINATNNECNQRIEPMKAYECKKKKRKDEMRKRDKQINILFRCHFLFYDSFPLGNEMK